MAIVTDQNIVGIIAAVGIAVASWIKSYKTDAKVDAAKATTDAQHAASVDAINRLNDHNTATTATALTALADSVSPAAITAIAAAVQAPVPAPVADVNAQEASGP